MTDHRTNNFDGLRLVAALAVLLSHMAALSGRSQWLAVADQDWGDIGVLVFFSISGYLVTASWRKDPDLGRFLTRRFLRIAPALLVAVPVTFSAVVALGLYGFPGNTYHTLNGSLWTITYEVQCYLLLAGLCMWTKQPILIGAAVAVVGQVYWPQHDLVHFAPFFVLGSLLYEYPRIRRWSWAIVGLGVAVLPLRPIVGLALIVAPLSIAIGTRSWPGLRLAGRYGDLSYGVYIYAWPVQQIVVAYMGPASYAVLLAVTMPLVLSCAWLSWRYVERPALVRKPTVPPPPSYSPTLSPSQPPQPETPH